MTISFDQQQLEQNAIFEIERWIGSINAEIPWPVFAEKARGLCDNFLILATTSLYKNLKIEMFQHNLCRAAANWCKLTDAINISFPEKNSSLHYNIPVYAAIIAGDSQLHAG